MKKTFITLTLLIFMAGGYDQLSAQDNTDQRILIGVEVVKPNMMPQYQELCKELVEMCTDNNFPYSFDVWNEGFAYYLFYNIESLNDIEEIGNAWDEIIEIWGSEKYDSFNECIDYTEDRTMTLIPDLFYISQNPYINEEDIGFCRVQEISIKKGHEKEAEELFQRGNTLLEGQEAVMNGYFAKGGLGFEKPVYIFWQYGETMLDFYAQQKTNQENRTDKFVNDWQNLNNDLLNHLRTIENSHLSYTKNLSFSVEE